MQERFFETIRIEDGNVAHLPYHQRRFERTSGLDLDLSSFISPPKEGVYRCKLIYDSKQILEVVYYRYKRRQLATLKLQEIDFEYEKKYLDRSNIDRVFEQRGECDDVLMIKDSLIQDTSIANVAFFNSKEWLTPKKPLLYGTTRQRYIDAGIIQEADIGVDMLSGFTKIAFMNAMIDFVIMSLEKINKDTLRVNEYNERL